MQFAVKIDGEDEGRWVLEVDPIGERLLITNEEGRLRWVDMSDCSFLKLASPDEPRAVIMVKPANQGMMVPNLRMNGN